MSQVDKFNQLNNPDYVYFDLQQTNIYNTTTQEQQPLKFLETRETPIIKNTGDYYMSVARFQLDTYNLPVIVGEPDLTQTGTFDPDKTIYKVAMNITNSNLLTDVEVNNYTVSAEIQDQNYPTMGAQIRTAFDNNDTTIFAAISDPSAPSANGTYLNQGIIRIWEGTNSNNYLSYTLRLDSAGTTFAGANLGQSFLSMSANGLRVVASTFSQGTYLWNIVNNSIITPILIGSFATNLGQTSSSISGNGNFIFVGNRVNRFEVFNCSNPSAITQVGGTINITTISGYTNNGGFFDSTGTYLMVQGDGTIGTEGYIEIRTLISNVWATSGNVFSGATGDNLGRALAMSSGGVYCCASAVRSNSSPAVPSYVKVYKRTGTTWTVSATITALVEGSVTVGQWGRTISMSSDGSIITVGAASSGNKVYIYKRATGGETYSLLDTVSNTDTQFGRSSVINSSGNVLLATSNSGSLTTLSPVYVYNLQTTPAGTVFPIPNEILTIPTIESVKWIKDLEDATAPTQNSLTGKNTALYPYYYCNSYNNFITMVNKTMKLAYKNFIERLYNDWILQINISTITNQFLDITAKHYPTPPFIDWNETNLTADVYVSMLYETYQTAANTVINNINYAMPQTTWAVVSTNNVGTPLADTPFKFELAFNAPLYSLFSSLPATKKVITNSTGKKELYYTLNFYSSGLGLVTPSPALNSIIAYSFLSTYTDSAGIVTFPNTGTKNYSHSKLLIKQSQEISTIDTWTPVNAIVFTTTSIPIIVNQFTASSSIGSSPPSSSLDNAFAFVITDLQSNQQGYRPNILLTPKIYRMIDLTGNQSLKNIDINVFWRTKTGTLIPFTLASGAMSSIKLLFQKKVLGENQQINLASMSVRNIQ